MTDQDRMTLPRGVIRPLRAAAVTVVCFLVLAGGWSATARIATTVRVPGSLQAPQTGHPVQHVEGGRIEDLPIARHGSVRAGDLLVRFDTGREEVQLSALLTQIAVADAEARLIAQLLSLPPQAPLPTGFGDNDPPEVVERLRQGHGLMQAQLQAQDQIADGARARQSIAQDEVTMLAQRLAIAEGRFDRLAHLSQTGVLRRAEAENLEDRVLVLRSQMLEAQSELRELMDSTDRATRERDVILGRYTTGLAEERSQTLRARPDLVQRADQLRARIAQASLVAPFDGVVDNLLITAPGAVAAPGQVLAVLTRQIEQPTITARIPLHVIDQVRPGMTGQLTLAGVPMRDAPDLSATLVAISQEAEKGPDGTPTHYVARAELLGDGAANLSELRIAADMPVSLALEGRHITFFEFLFAPISAMFDDAFQDA